MCDSGTAMSARSMLKSEGKECRCWGEPNKIASELSGYKGKLILAS